MYQSPIKIIEQIQHDLLQQKEDGIYRAVVKVGVDVDKEELIRALQYDRGQYEQGFRDGVASANQWIPVAERPPDLTLDTWIDEDGSVYDYEISAWVWGIDMNGMQDRVRYETGPVFQGWYNDRGTTYAITHWMPLPEPPKEE